MSGVIPKEKLAGYQRWQVGSFDRPAPSQPAVGESPAQPAMPTESGVAETIVDMPFPTVDELARINDEARAEGYQNGYQEGLARGEAEAAENTSRQLHQISALVGNLQVSLAHLDQEIADQLLDLSLEVANQIIRNSLEVDRSLLLPVIREALAELPFHHGAISLHLNPEDAADLNDLLKEQLTHTSAHLVADAGISPGGCHIKAGNCEIDATIETRWQRSLDAIGAEPRAWMKRR